MPKLRASETPSNKKSDHYDDPDYNYQDYWQGREYEHEAEKIALKRLLEDKHFENAVDIGGGYGRLSVVLKEFADIVTIVEPSKQQLTLAAEYLEDHADIKRVHAAAENLPFNDGSVDLITMIRVMHHLPDHRREFAEIARVLSPNGYAVIEVANYQHVRNRIKHIIRNQKFPSLPVNIRTEIRRDDEVPFVNHNPHIVRKHLTRSGLKVERILSVSNLRSSSIKKLIPKRAMLAIEGVLQPTLARGFFGPSIFYLVRKIQ